ncbi:hypothetical protein [Paraburkholderia oxyphila]|uniref:hypothetical protein n=1 Tax=Paraburkholderia oxyphila TaxID=614212 RepID=UPI00047F3049|nr:hypothetical protein [Paraburkholderia oxyphila]
MIKDLASLAVFQGIQPAVPCTDYGEESSMLRTLNFIVIAFFLATAYQMLNAYNNAQKACIEVVAMQTETASTGDNAEQEHIRAKTLQCERKAHVGALIGEAWMSLFPNKS